MGWRAYSARREGRYLHTGEVGIPAKPEQFKLRGNSTKEEPMKKIAARLFILFMLCGGYAYATTNPNPPAQPLQPPGGSGGGGSTCPPSCSVSLPACSTATCDCNCDCVIITQSCSNG
jgi:hypothetical protein